jgi:hypothetical protein
LALPKLYYHHAFAAPSFPPLRKGEKNAGASTRQSPLAKGGVGGVVSATPRTLTQTELVGSSGHDHPPYPPSLG